MYKSIFLLMFALVCYEKLNAQHVRNETTAPFGIKLDDSGSVCSNQMIAFLQKPMYFLQKANRHLLFNRENIRVIKNYDLDLDVYTIPIISKRNRKIYNLIGVQSQSKNKTDLYLLSLKKSKDRNKNLIVDDIFQVKIDSLSKQQKSPYLIKNIELDSDGNVHYQSEKQYFSFAGIIKDFDEPDYKILRINPVDPYEQLSAVSIRTNEIFQSLKIKEITTFINKPNQNWLRVKLDRILMSESYSDWSIQFVKRAITAFAENKPFLLEDPTQNYDFENDEEYLRFKENFPKSMKK